MKMASKTSQARKKKDRSQVTEISQRTRRDHHRVSGGNPVTWQEWNGPSKTNGK